MSAAVAEVLLEMKWCGICGTDMQAYSEGIDERYVTLPVVLGHESSGVVYKLGAGVTHLKPGDRPTTLVRALAAPARNDLSRLVVNFRAHDVFSKYCDVQRVCR